MRLSAGVAAVSCVCPLVVFLCVVPQSCYGTHTNPNPDLDPSLRLKSLPEPTQLPRSSLEKVVSPSDPSQSIRSRTQFNPRFDTVSNSTNHHRPNTLLSSTISKAILSSNAGPRQQHLPKQISNSKPGFEFKLNVNQVAANGSNHGSQFSEKTKTSNPGSVSLLQPNHKVSPRSKVTQGSKTNAKSGSNSQSSKFSNQAYNSSGAMSPSTYYNIIPAALSSLKSRSRIRPSLQPSTNAKYHSSFSNMNSKSSVRAQRNQTKSMETDKDSQHRPKRGWIWNQFFVLEEHIGPDPQYVGKVRYICFYLLFQHRDSFVCFVKIIADLETKCRICSSCDCNL